MHLGYTPKGFPRHVETQLTLPPLKSDETCNGTRANLGVSAPHVILWPWATVASLVLTSKMSQIGRPQTGT
jgi:hypothetical protein